MSVAQQDPKDPEMQPLWALGQSLDGHFAVRSKHGVQLLYRTAGGKSLLVVPATTGQRQLLMEELHCGLSGHFGPARSLAALQLRVWWPKMARDVK